MIHTGFHVPHATRDIAKVDQVFGYRIVTFYNALFQMLHLTITNLLLLSHNPIKTCFYGLG